MNTLQIIEGVALGGLIGLVLATVGAGGAIIAVPGLIAFFSLSATSATTSSLVIVGAAAIMGAIQKFKTKSVDLKLGLTFSLLGIAGTFLGTRIVEYVSESIILTAFAILMLVSAVMMWNKKPIIETARKPKTFAVFVVASGVGLITGFLGIGGGFLIVPALVLTLGVNAKVAVGTSLVAIAINTLIALGFRYEYWSELPWDQVGLVALSAVIVSAVAAPISHKLPEIKIQKAFAAILVVLTIYLAYLAI